MYKKRLFYVGFKKSNIFIFPMIKRAVNYAEISRVGKLEACFQQDPLVQIF